MGNELRKMFGLGSTNSLSSAGTSVTDSYQVGTETQISQREMDEIRAQQKVAQAQIMQQLQNQQWNMPANAPIYPTPEPQEQGISQEQELRTAMREEFKKLIAEFIDVLSDDGVTIPISELKKHLKK